METAFHSSWVGGDGKAACSDAAALALFPWWSFSKTVLAIVALRLMEAGKLELDVPLDPNRFTLRQLLLHRAGVPNYGRLKAYHDAVANGEDAWPRAVLLDAISAQTLDFAPGTAWAYSNVGYLFVRDTIEKAANLPLDELIREWVTDPLGLMSVRLATTRADLADMFWPELKSYDPSWVYHGCLIGTPVDAARLLHAVFTGGLLRASSMDEIFARSTTLGGQMAGRPWTSHGYALGLMTGSTSGCGRAWGHTGAGPFSVNAVYHFPDLEEPITVATIARGMEEGAVETEATKIAGQA